MNATRSFPQLIVLLIACTLVGGGVIEIVLSGPRSPGVPPVSLSGPPVLGLGCVAEYTLDGSPPGAAGWHVVRQGGDADLVALGRAGSPYSDGRARVALRATEIGPLLVRVYPGVEATAPPLELQILVTAAEACA